ncbi:Gfo/Idh/MocA family protein [Exilibacterium tricleocarpae]|nr:Gfo/Idh/MocA family oxidoreductase [Exilibacterium tricleocarpae]
MTVEPVATTPLNAAVVGLGGIGLKYDLGGGGRITTHARAFHVHNAFHLAAAVDPDAGARSQFESTYGAPAYADLAHLFRKHRVDVVALAVPTEHHGAVLEMILEYPVRLVLCEKPLATSVAEGEHMLALAGQKQVTLMVNYMRRCEPGVHELRQRIESGALGRCHKGVVWYCNGLANNASHFIDLLMLLFGPVVDCGLLPGASSGGARADTCADFYLQWPALRICFFSVDAADYSCNEMEVFGTRGTFRYRNGGMNIDYRFGGESPWFKGYTALQKDALDCPTDLLNYQYHVADAIHKRLQHRDGRYDNAAAALETLRVVEQLRNEAEG